MNGQKLQQRTKQIVLGESTAEDVSSEWSHRRISPTSSKVRTTVQQFIFPPGSERVTVVGLVQFCRTLGGKAVGHGLDYRSSLIARI